MALYTQPRVCRGASSDQTVAVAANTMCTITPSCESGGLPRNPASGLGRGTGLYSRFTPSGFGRGHSWWGARSALSIAEFPGPASVLPGSTSEHWVTCPRGTSANCLPADGDSTPQPHLRKLAGHGDLSENYAPG